MCGHGCHWRMTTTACVVGYRALVLVTGYTTHPPSLAPGRQLQQREQAPGGARPQSKDTPRVGGEALCPRPLLVPSRLPPPSTWLLSPWGLSLATEGSVDSNAPRAFVYKDEPLHLLTSAILCYLKGKAPLSTTPRYSNHSLI